MKERVNKKRIGHRNARQNYEVMNANRSGFTPHTAITVYIAYVLYSMQERPISQFNDNYVFISDSLVF